MKAKIIIGAIALAIGASSGILGTYFYADGQAKKMAMSDEVTEMFVFAVSYDVGENWKQYIIDIPAERLIVTLETQTIMFRLTRVSPFYYQWMEYF